MPAFNLERRIKRKAWAPDWTFFASCPPGLEGLCAAELAGLGLAGLEPSPGGVYFPGRLAEAYRANLWLRSAGRVLLRLADFRVRVLADLERQAKAVPWEVFLEPEAPLLVRVNLKQGALRHSGAAGEALQKGLALRFQELGLALPRPGAPDDPGRQMIQLRNRDRRASISLDTSGPHLHKRGYRLATAKAPLRENLAAALLLFCGYDGSQPLIDPMCGSGTLAIEAALLARRLPPGLERGLAMEHWPAHREPTWAHLKKAAIRDSLAKAPRTILARDQNNGAMEACRANAERAGVLGDLSLAREDFLSAAAPPGPGLLVCNPPYGKRIGSVRQAERFVMEMGKKLGRDYRGWRAGLVLYRPEWRRFLPLRETQSLTVPVGGLKLTLLHGLIA